MAVKANKKGIEDASTQRFLPFSQIRENFIIMKDGGMRIVLECSAINFLLKSTEEQDAIILSFQRFLNALDFPIQIIVQSKKLNIDEYIQKLQNYALQQKNPLLQNQTYEYIAFLKKLIEVAQIMKKSFYIVVPYDTVDNSTVRDISFFGKLKNFWASLNSGDDILKIRAQIKQFQKMKKELLGRVNVIRTSLEGIGIKVRELNKEELIALLSDYYNPTLSGTTTGKDFLQNYSFSG